MYGEQYISTWLKKNKGKTFLNLITMSDVANAKTLVLNSHEVWEEDLEVREKMAKYTENNRKVSKLLMQTITKIS